MDENYYSDKTREDFIKTNLCKGDATLLRYYENNDVQKFRKRLVRVSDDDAVEQVVYTFVTDAIRDILYDIIGKLTMYMRPMGDLVISGGEAFNIFFDKGHRIVTSDIDTKFVPTFTENVFRNLQVSKILLWDKLGGVSENFENVISKRVKKFVETSRVGRLLGIKIPSKGPYVNRRYTLIRKKKQSNKNNVQEKDVLIDVEVFALDLKLRYFLPGDNKVTLRNLGGILDIAFMRPGEIGYEVVFSREKGLFYKKFGIDEMVYNKNILFADKRFLIEDLYIMNSLGLRPHKKKKDQKRIYTFAKKVLKLQNIPKTGDIFEKVLKSIPKPRTRVIRKRTIPYQYVELAKKVNPLKYQSRTTPVEKSKKLLIGLKGTKNLNLQNFKPTMSNYRFNLTTQKWVRDGRPSYIRNTYNYRLKELPNKIKESYRARDVLYGYNPVRNRRVHPQLIKSAALIQFVGLKNRPTIS
jgi:hypothetical protein